MAKEFGKTCSHSNKLDLVSLTWNTSWQFLTYDTMFAEASIFLCNVSAIQKVIAVMKFKYKTNS